MPREEADCLDSRVMKAGIAMAIGMTLLIPTFNAINNSYIEVTEVPSWMPPPDKLPENFRPPEDFKPPEDWTPPPDWEPPEGWEDWEPPEDWEGKMEGFPPPPGSCPPPVPRYPPEGNKEFSMDGEANDWEATLSFDAPEYTGAVIVEVRVRNWTSPQIRGAVTPPAGMDFGAEKTASNGGGGTFGIPSANPPTPKAETVWNWTWDPREHNNELPEPGTYTLDLAADAPDWLNGQLRGRWQVKTILILPCGGAFQ